MLNLKAKAKLPTENPLATNIYFDNSYSKEALTAFIFIIRLSAKGANTCYTTAFYASLLCRPADTSNRINDYYQAWEPPFSHLRATLFLI